ncbi:transposase [Colletotrichum tofieldiae]|nr:transposase [Colletotrichum tofieldiae]
MTILKPIWKMTLRTQGLGQDGSHGRLWEVITAMEYLLSHFEGWKTFYNRRFDESSLPAHARQEYINIISNLEEMGSSSQQYLRTSINNGWKKLDEYYTLTEESPLTAAALILHPAFNLKYMERNWRSPRQQEWVSNAKLALKRYLNRWYPSEEGEGMRGVSQRPEPHEPDDFEQWVQAEATILEEDNDEELDELEKYFALQRQANCNPVEWWFAHKEEYPRLSRLALMILAIPSQSSDCERAFSAASLAQTSQRLGMKVERLEMLQCMRQWQKRGAISLLDRSE